MTLGQVAIGPHIRGSGSDAANIMRITAMKTTALAALIAALSAPACLYGATGESPRLAVTFEPAANTGSVMISVFDSESAYSGGVPIRQARIDVAKGERTAVFADLKAGDYAIKAFHDVNGDGKMNTNPFGLPIEPVAFSNNARPNMGPASWVLARVAVKGSVAQIIRIR
jgi:uncharacterized protein (DUF2141 family)